MLCWEFWGECFFQLVNYIVEMGCIIFYDGVLFDDIDYQWFD